MPDAKPAVVLFDLGGVIVRLAGVGDLQTMAGLNSPEEVGARWLSCPWVRRFERGTCTPDEFAADVLIKPDREVFDHVASMLDEPPERLLFLDDSPINVEQAQLAGWRAVRVQGANEARAALEAAGVLAG